MPVYRMTIEYDGAPFSGWQIQPGRATVQAALEEALATALRTPTGIVGAGRTDAGVHARGQVAHFLAPGGTVDTRRLLASLNGLLPDAIAIRTLAVAPDGFHARYGARLRRYRYYITTGFRALDRHMRVHIRPEPDFALMQAAANALLGEHDFDTFCRTQSETKNRVCTLHQALWTRESGGGDAYFEIAANRFLHGMVRTIVGTLLEIGHGKRPVDDMARLLTRKDRRAAGPSAPAHGLVLEEVVYGEDVQDGDGHRKCQ